MISRLEFAIATVDWPTKFGSVGDLLRAGESGAEARMLFFFVGVEGV